MLNSGQGSTGQPANPQLQNHTGSTSSGISGAPQRDRNNRKSRQQYRLKPRSAEEQASSSELKGASVNIAPLNNPQALAAAITVTEAVKLPEAQPNVGKTAAASEALTALFGKSKSDTSDAPVAQLSPHSGSQLAEVEERLFANADASVAGLQSAEARLQRYVMQRAELDQLFLEEAKRINLEAERLAKTREAQRLLADQLEAERKERKEIEDKLTAELGEKTKELHEMQGKCSEREQLIATQEQSIKTLTAELAEHQHRLNLALQELNATKHQYFLKNEEVAKLQLENFQRSANPAGEVFRNMEVQAVMERAEQDKNWYVQNLNQLVSDKQRLEAQLQQLQRHTAGSVQPPPHPLGMPPQDPMAPPPQPFGASDGDKMMYFGKHPPPGFQHPHYHPSSGDRMPSPAGPVGPPLGSSSPLSRKNGSDVPPGPVEDPFAPTANGRRDPQAAKPPPPGFLPDGSQQLASQNRPDALFKPDGINNGSLMAAPVNGVSSSQPLAPIGHPIGHPWRPTFEHFPTSSGPQHMASPTPPPPSDRHTSLNSADPVLNYPHNRPAPPWGQPQVPIQHPQKVDPNKALAPGLANPTVGMKPDQLQHGPPNFGPNDPKVVGAPGPTMAGTPIGPHPGVQGHGHPQGLIGVSAAAPHMPPAPMRMSMRQEMVVTPLAPNRLR